MTRLGPIVVFAVLFAGCSKWPLDTHWESGGYRLIAIDADSQMALISQDSGISLVDATVFSIGADDRFIVLKQHPAREAGALTFDRSVTNYFVVERRGGGYPERKKGVSGPLKKEEFDRLAASLSLPPFSKTFRQLE